MFEERRQHGDMSLACALESDQYSTLPQFQARKCISTYVLGQLLSARPCSVSPLHQAWL